MPKLPDGKMKVATALGFPKVKACLGWCGGTHLAKNAGDRKCPKCRKATGVLSRAEQVKEGSQ